MRAYDIVAYTVDGDILCPEHAFNTESPVFASDEGWEEHCCSECLHIAISNNETPLTLGESQ